MTPSWLLWGLVDINAANVYCESRVPVYMRVWQSGIQSLRRKDGHGTYVVYIMTISGELFPVVGNKLLPSPPKP